MEGAAAATRVSSGERINAGERPGRLEAELGSRGRRLTRQRRVIVRVMDTAQRHLDIDQIYERARGRENFHRLFESEEEMCAKCTHMCIADIV